eukprot:TRINITY_DN1993_c0_g1_i1.p1 TRINITY_DN1993_c0_g1~~TRINITY_DN1993_c0_g1_i1.p1  ORF type:complete len:415 (-),score=80.87 TRINITY_DN1993_c0_g1_i1:63-1307(-)
MPLFQKGPLFKRFADIFCDETLYKTFEAFAFEKHAINLLHCVRDILYFKYVEQEPGKKCELVSQIAVQYFGYSTSEEDVFFADMKVSVQISEMFIRRVKNVIYGEQDWLVFEGVLAEMLDLLETVFSEFCSYVVQLVYNDDMKKKKFFVMSLADRFYELLHDDYLYSQYEAYLVSCFCSENLSFYKDVHHFKVRKQRPETMLTEARIIADKYLREDSEVSITTEHFMSIPNILEKIDSGNVNSKIFDQIYYGVVDALETKFLEFCSVVNKDVRKGRITEYERFKAAKYDLKKRFEYLILDPFLYSEVLEYLKERNEHKILLLYYELYNIVYLNHRSDSLSAEMISFAKNYLAYKSKRKRALVIVSEEFKDKLFHILDNSEPVDRTLFYELLLEILPEIKIKYQEFATSFVLESS